MVEIQGTLNSRQLTYALFTKQGIVEELGLNGPSVCVSVSGFGGKQDHISIQKSDAHWHLWICLGVVMGLKLLLRQICQSTDAVGVDSAQ